MNLLPDDPKLTAYALGELNATERAEIEAALKHSPECRQVVEEIQQLGGLLTKDLAEEPCLTLDEERRGLVMSGAIGAPASGTAHWNSATPDTSVPPISPANRTNNIIPFPQCRRTAMTAIAALAACAAMIAMVWFPERRTTAKLDDAQALRYQTKEQRVAALFQEGRLLYELRRFDEAERDFNLALALDPGHAESKRYLTFIPAARSEINGSRKYVYGNPGLTNSVTATTTASTPPGSGKLMGGFFINYDGGIPRTNAVVMDANGAIVSTQAVVYQADGKVLIGGNFTNVMGGIAVTSNVRIGPNGEIIPASNSVAAASKLATSTNANGLTGRTGFNYLGYVNQLLREYVATAGVKVLRTNAAQIFYNDRKGMVLVRGTPDELHVIEQALSALNVNVPVVPSQTTNAPVPVSGVPKITRLYNVDANTFIARLEAATGKTVDSLVQKATGQTSGVPTVAQNKEQRIKVAELVQDGRLLYELRRLDDAEKKLTAALALDPKMDSADYYLKLVADARIDEELRKHAFTYDRSLLAVETKWNEQVKTPNTLPQPKAGTPSHDLTLSTSGQLSWGDGEKAPKSYSMPADVSNPGLFVLGTSQPALPPGKAIVTTDPGNRQVVVVGDAQTTKKIQEVTANLDAEAKRGQAVVAILDDDAKLNFVTASSGTGEKPGSATVTANRVGGSMNMNSLAVQSDGKTVISGTFPSVNGTSRNSVPRLNTDGSLATDAAPALDALGAPVLPTNPESEKTKVLFGKVVVGGGFTFFNGSSRGRVARLNVDGTLDTTFNPQSGEKDSVRALAQQTNGQGLVNTRAPELYGKLIAGGEFTTFNGTTVNRIVRLNHDGSADSNYVFIAGNGGTTDSYAVQNLQTGQQPRQPVFVYSLENSDPQTVKKALDDLFDSQIPAQERTVQLLGTKLNPEHPKMKAEVQRLAQLKDNARVLAEKTGNTAAYPRYYEAPFVPVVQQPLSTFSIDVDTASYANVRRFLNAGQLPPRDAVRVEELVNYFSYNYPLPKGDDPFSVNIESASCPWDGQHRLVRVALKGREIANDKRPPSNFVFLIDVSGSMQPAERLPLIKQGLRMLVKKMNTQDHVAIVVYASSCGIVLPSTSCEQKEKILAAIDGLEAGGSTNGGEGIQRAYDVAAENFIKGGINRVLLCTDGDFNVGITDQSQLLKMIEQKAKSGVFLTTLGVGTDNYKDALMQKLADKGNGNYHYLDSVEEAHKVLIEQMNGTLVTIAKDVKIQVEFNPAQVSAYRLVGYEKRALRAKDFNDDTKDAGEIGAGHTITAFYEIMPVGTEIRPVSNDLKYQATPRPEPAFNNGNPEMLTLKLRYKQPEGSVSKLLEFPYTDDHNTYRRASTDFKFATAVASFGLILRSSDYKGGANLDGILELAEEAKGADAQGYRAEFINLVKKAKELAR